ncbi:MAG: TIGR02530 family flagellar biosynthesis protein [Candidatus Hydrogenedentota bacterium]
MNYSDLRLKKIEFKEIDLKVGSSKDVKPLLISDLSFSEVLGKAIEQAGDLKFSAHSLKRLYSRGIKLTDKEILSLLDAISKAESKHCRESLIILERVGFIVNLPNSTVVTAMDIQSMKDNIFTNIDSAIIRSSELGVRSSEFGVIITNH